MRNMLTPRNMLAPTDSLIPVLLFVVISVFGLKSPLPAAEPSDQQPPKLAKHVIDTHIHLFDPTREVEIPWPSKKDPVLYKPHLPAEFNPIAKAAGVTGVVIVEASDLLDDNQWILDLVEGDDFYLGFVGNVDLNRDDFEQQILKLSQDARFKGIRPRGGNSVDYSDPRVLKNLQVMSDQKMTLDYLARGDGTATIETIERVARKFPELHIVINHCFNHRFDGNLPEDERMAAIKKLAENKNVWLKLSGFYQQSIPLPTRDDPEHYLPAINQLWETFGDERVIYGSNWPVTKRAGSYADLMTLIDRVVSQQGQAACERYYWKNAAEAYRLPLQ